MTYFDKQAKEWDNDPKKIERATVFAKEIENYIKPNKKLSAFEFGCGTGLLSFQLKDAFKTITLADNSEGMINVLKEKIQKSGINNFEALHIDLFSDKIITNGFDVVYTLMTLHHIINIEHIISIFSSTLKHGGYLCIADLVQEDGSFHTNQEDFEGHNGFNQAELNKILSDNGFDVVYYKICFEIEKILKSDIKKYPLFLIIGKKQ